jgi:hypothetical protein
MKFHHAHLRAGESVKDVVLWRGECYGHQACREARPEPGQTEGAGDGVTLAGNPGDISRPLGVILQLDPQIADVAVDQLLSAT